MLQNLCAGRMFFAGVHWQLQCMPFTYLCVCSGHLFWSWYQEFHWKWFRLYYIYFVWYSQNVSCTGGSWSHYIPHKCTTLFFCKATCVATASCSWCSEVESSTVAQFLGTDIVIVKNAIVEDLLQRPPHSSFDIDSLSRGLDLSLQCGSVLSVFCCSFWTSICVLLFGSVLAVFCSSLLGPGFNYLFLQQCWILFLCLEVR